MSFTYIFKHDDDKVYFAYGLPYTFSMLSSFMAEIEKVQTQEKNINSPIVKISTAGLSLSGISIPMITITDFTCKSPKKTIFMNGRVHPGETHASWVFHGLIHFLLSKQDVAKELRKRVVFKLVPMLNVDGVIGGNYRTSFAGLDINRMFGDSVNKRLNPESTKLKELILEDKRINFYLDLHGHSNKKSIFMYGPHFPLHSEHYMKIRVLPKLMQ